MQQAKFTYSPLGKAFEKYAGTIKEYGDKQFKLLKSKKSDKSYLILKQVKKIIHCF